jgi:hypothetical protein
MAPDFLTGPVVKEYLSVVYAVQYEADRRVYEGFAPALRQKKPLRKDQNK